ncbi:MAG: hypothetical protein ACOY45_17295 [Pseudomonadota bacterium]
MKLPGLASLRPMLLALLTPLVLTGCLFLPGKFTSSLELHADRSFTYTYVGEVQALDIKKMMLGAMMGAISAGTEGEDADEDMGKDMGEDNAPAMTETSPEEQAKTDEEMKKMAAALEQEAGYRKVEYRGNGLFYVDYQISGTMNHAFVFPFDTDAGMMFPFVAVELRGKDVVQFRAPGMVQVDDTEMEGFQMASKAEGTFTLTTDAEVLESNGTAGTANGKKTLTWTITPESKDPPAAKLRVNPVP